AALAQQKLDGEEAPFYRAKLDTARFFMERLLPQAGALLAAIASGGRTMLAFDTDRF
ncbi:MAG: hypothetical protein GWP66_09515, partial [Gammaproteobacteria bacterium]|nr:hypothetical protein [Gammaproteobacteria bacterium]